jgi:hypothetical protein
MNGATPVGTILRRRFDMGITEAEFFRLLPAATGEPFVVHGRVIEHQGANRSWRIGLGPSGQRAIGRLRLPTLAVSFEFDGYLAVDVDAFMERFFRYFRRGGG